jgi:hypothetical protein
LDGIVGVTRTRGIMELMDDGVGIYGRELFALEK